MGGQTTLRARASVGALSFAQAVRPTRVSARATTRLGKKWGELTRSLSHAVNSPRRGRVEHSHTSLSVERRTTRRVIRRRRGPRTPRRTERFDRSVC